MFLYQIAVLALLMNSSTIETRIGGPIRRVVNYSKTCVVLCLLLLLPSLASSEDKVTCPDTDLLKATLSSLTQIGVLKLSNIPIESVQIPYCHNIEGDILPWVIVNYPIKGAPKPQNVPRATLGPLQGTIVNFNFSGYFTTNSFSPSSQTLVMVKPGKFQLTINGGKSEISIGIAKSVSIEGIFVQMKNIDLLSLSRTNPQEPAAARGTLELKASNLKPSGLEMVFYGEKNTFSVKAKNIKMPGQTVWRYSLSTRRATWESGTVILEQMSGVPDPLRVIHFGGMDIDLEKLEIFQLSVKKKVSDPLADVSMRQLSIAGKTIEFGQPGLSGTLQQPLSIGYATAKCKIREEYFETYDLDMNNATLALSNITFTDNKGLKIFANKASISIASYKGKETAEQPTKEGEEPPDREFVEAKMSLSDGRMAMTGAVDGIAYIGGLDMSVKGKPDKLDGSGSTSIRFASVSGDVPIYPKDLFPDDSEKAFIREAGSRCPDPIIVKVEQSALIKAQLALMLTKGEVSAVADVDFISAIFTPQSYKCEWNQPVFEFQVFALCWENLWTVRRCDYTQRINVHWLAELNSTGPKVGGIANSQIRLKDGKAKLCGGRAGLFPGMWSVTITPGFNDCGQWYCNIVRDAVRTWTTIYQTPFTSFIGSLGGVVLPFIPFSCED